MGIKLKKTILFVFLLSVIFCTCSVYAEYSETLVKELAPDAFMVEATYKGTTYPVGTLPTSSNGYFFSDTTPTGLNRGLTLRMMNTGVAKYENGTDGNVVFVIGGSDDCALSGATGMGQHPSYRQSIRMKILNKGQNKMCLLATSDKSGPYYIEEGLTKSGVYFRAGGAYVYDYDKGEDVYFIEQGTLEEDKWYRVESYTDFQGTNQQLQNAKVFDDETGELIGQSGWLRVSELKPEGGVQNFCRGANAPEVMLDDWKVYKCEGIERVSFNIETDTVNRRVYKLVADRALEGSLFDESSVVLKADNESLNLNGKYTVSYNAVEKAVIVTANEPLPYNESFTIEVNCLPSDENGMLAVDISDTSGLVKAFSTGVDLFEVNSVYLDADNCAVITMSNPTAEKREYLAIVSAMSAEKKYLETMCIYGNLEIGASNNVVTVPAISVPDGGEIWVVVWDNWDGMNALCETYVIEAQ